MAYLYLSYKERVYVERGAMGAMSLGFSIGAGLGGEGVVKAAKRRVFGGETLLFSEFTAEYEGAWVAVSPAFPGDIEVIEVDEAHPLLVETGSLLAYSQGVHGDVRFTGLKTMVMHEGVALIELAGNGQAVLSSYGGIERFVLGEGDEIIVDTGHIVAFSETVEFNVGPLSSVTHAVTTGEGFVASMTGPGIVYIQTRAEQALRSWLFPENDQNPPRNR